LFKRMLIYLDPARTRLEELEGVLDLASALHARLIALAVIPPESQNMSKEEKELRDELEDRTWNFLYGIEEIAFEREIKISLMLEEGEAEKRIASVAKSYEADICATFLYKEIKTGRLLGALGGVPLLLLNQEGR
jgi:hypothetical protein